jgi:hypothetical protein
MASKASSSTSARRTRVSFFDQRSPSKASAWRLAGRSWRARDTGIDFALRLRRPAGSISISLRKISRSLAGSSLAGRSRPRMTARARISGLRPFQ